MNKSYLALNSSLAAATVARVTVQTTIAAAFLPGEPDGSELRFLACIYPSDARGAQQGPAALRGQWLQEETVIHLHSIHVQVLI